MMAFEHCASFERVLNARHLKKTFLGVAASVLPITQAKNEVAELRTNVRCPMFQREQLHICSECVPQLDTCRRAADDYRLQQESRHDTICYKPLY